MKIKYLLITIFIIITSCSDLTVYQDPGLFNPKVAMSFDDQNIDSWYPNFKYLKNKYPEFTATMYVTNFNLLNDSDVNKYKELYDLGFEIGGHNPTHERSTDYLQLNGSDGFKQLQIETIDFWDQHGIIVKSFAYPFGASNDETDLALIDIYSVIRYTSRNYLIYENTQYIGGYYFDHNNNEAKEELILNILENNKNTDTIVSTYGHGISIDGGICKTKLSSLELWIEYCIENNYQFINVEDINKN